MLTKTLPSSFLQPQENLSAIRFLSQLVIFISWLNLLKSEQSNSLTILFCFFIFLSIVFFYSLIFKSCITQSKIVSFSQRLQTRLRQIQEKSKKLRIDFIKAQGNIQQKQVSVVSDPILLFIIASLYLLSINYQIRWLLFLLFTLAGCNCMLF